MSFLAKERVDNDKNIKQRQRSMLGSVQKQRDELRAKLEAITQQKQQVDTTYSVTVDQANQASQKDQQLVSEYSEVVVVDQTNNGEYERMKNELEELRNRNKDLEEYYDENTKKTNNAHKVLTDYEKLQQTVQQLQTELESVRKQSAEQQKQPIVIADRKQSAEQQKQPIVIADRKQSAEQQKQPIVITDRKQSAEQQKQPIVITDHLCFTGGCKTQDKATQKPSTTDAVVPL